MNDEIDLNNLFSFLRRRKKFITSIFLMIMGFSVIVTTLQRTLSPLFLGSFTLLINDPLNKKNTSSSNLLAEGLIEDLARNTTDNDIPTLIELLKSPYLLTPLAEKYNMRSKTLSNKISIVTGGKDRFDKRANGILKINLRSKNPQKDITLLNDLSDLYLETALNQKRQRLIDGLDFLNKQAPQLASKTAELQTELAIFRQNNSLLEPNIEGSALKKLEEDVLIEILRLESERERLERVNTELKNGNINVLGFETGIDSNESKNYTFQGKGLAVSTSDQSLVKEILIVKSELAKALSKYQPTSKKVKNIKDRLKELEPKLLENQIEVVQTALKLNLGRLNTANVQRDKIKETFSKQPELIKEYETILQRLKIAQDNLSGLISARETFQLEMAQRSFPWKIIEEPYFRVRPISPSIPKNFLYSLLISSFFSFLLGYLRDWSDSVFHNPGEIEETLETPFLASIPYVETFKEIREKDLNLLDSIENYVKDKDNKEDRYERFFYQESLRTLYTSIRFASSDQAVKIIEITSCLPSEGKSLVNILFAKTLAEIGKKVLLIDLDLRKPQIHKRLGLNNILGVSNLLTDNNTKLKDVIQKVDKYPNWSVITSGTRPPDPTLLLSSAKMTNFIEQLRNNDDYDIVLLDTTPIIGISDASLLADLSDALILIVSINKVDRNMPQLALKTVAETKSIKLGFIANYINYSKIKNNSYGYGYGYGYGYSYGYADYASYIDSDDNEEKDSKVNTKFSILDINVETLKKYFKKISDWIDN